MSLIAVSQTVITVDIQYCAAELCVKSPKFHRSVKEQRTHPGTQCRSLSLSLAVSAEVHRDLCLGVLLCGAGGSDFLSGGHLG